ncbi:hypothetical protein [Wolbachia endosymbiont (group A) of Campoletis raptor]
MMMIVYHHSLGPYILDDTFFYLVWVMQEVYCIPEQFDSLFFL